LHFTPTSGSWMNMVEIFFAVITRQAIRRGVFHTVTELQAAITRFIDAWNRNCRPSTWTEPPTISVPTPPEVKEDHSHDRGTAPAVSAATVNRKLAAVSAVYLFRYRIGVDVRRPLAGWQHGGRRGGSCQRMLLHLGEQPQRHSTMKLPTRRVSAQVLTDDQIKEPIGACERRRDPVPAWHRRGVGPEPVDDQPGDSAQHQRRRSLAGVVIFEIISAGWVPPATGPPACLGLSGSRVKWWAV